MQFIFAAIVLISFVEVKSSKIHKALSVEVKPVDTFENSLNLPSDIEPVKEQNFTEPNVVDTTISKTILDLLPYLLHGKVFGKQIKYPKQLKLKADNVIISENNIQDVLSPILQDESTISSLKVNDIEKESNDIKENINKENDNIYISSTDFVKPKDQKLKTDSHINPDLIPSAVGEGINSRKFIVDEDDHDIKENDLFYTSKGTTFPLTRAFDGISYLNIINKKSNQYKPPTISIEPTYQKLKMDNAATSGTNSQINLRLLPSLVNGGIYSRKLNVDEDDYNIKENDLFYTSKGTTSPLTRSFGRKSYLNIVNKINNEYKPPTISIKPTYQKLKMDNAATSGTKSNINPRLLSSLVGEGINLIKLNGNEDDYSKNGNDLFYTSKGNTFPLTRAFDGRNIPIANKKNDNLNIRSTDSLKPTDQKLNLDNAATSESNSDINSHLLPSLGIYTRKLNDNEGDYDIRKNDLFYTSKGITFPLKRTFDRRNIPNVHKKSDTPYIPSTDSVKPTDQKLNLENAATSESNSDRNPHLLPSLGIYSRKFNDNEDDDDINGNNLSYTSNGEPNSLEDDYDINDNDLYKPNNERIFSIAREFDQANNDKIENKQINPYFASNQFINPTEHMLNMNNAATWGINSHNNPHFFPNFVGGGIYSRYFNGIEDDYDINGNDLYYPNNGRTFPTTNEFDRANNVKIENRQMNPYVGSYQFVNPTEQILNMDNAATWGINSHINPHLYPSFERGGIYSRNFNGIEDDYDINDNDLYYPNNERIFPIAREFDQANNDKIENKQIIPHFASNQFIYPTEQMLNMNNAANWGINSHNNPHFFPSFVHGGMYSRNFDGIEDGYDINGNNLHYPNNERTFPTKNEFDRANKVKIENKQMNSYVAPNQFVNPTEQRLQTNNVASSKSESQDNNLKEDYPTLRISAETLGSMLG